MDNLTPEQRRRSADARRGQKRTQEQRDRIAAGTKRAWIEGKHDGQRGVPRSPETRLKISIAGVLAYKEGRLDAASHYKGKWRSYDGRINMRSQSEVLFAEKLDRYGIKWQYEPKRFDLGWCTYRPDFYLPEHDVWVEVKGWLTDKSAQKLDAFIALGYQLVLITYHEVREAGLPSSLKEVSLHGV